MTSKCDKCGSSKITYYKQTIKGGRLVVTARCENGHHPVTGKPFYPQYNFKMDELPALPQETVSMQLSWPLEAKPKPAQPYRNFPLEIK